MDYSTIKKEINQDYKGDKNFCTVVASSVAFDLPFKLVHDFYSENGRVFRKGLDPKKTNSFIIKLSEITGYKVSIFTVDKNHYYNTGSHLWINDKKQVLTQLKGSLTANNVESYLPIGNYILGVRGHVLGVENGIVQDWTRGKKHRINRIWKVEI